MFTLFIQTQFTNVSYDMDDESCDENNEDLFEEKLKDILMDIMVQNILFSKNIYDYFEIVIARHQIKISNH